MFKRSVHLFNFCSTRSLSMNEYVWTKQENVVMEPFDYIKKVPVKHPRSLAQAFNYWLQVPEETFHRIQHAVNNLITWIILCDDILDDSALRYGVPSAHRVFGVPRTIIAANKAIFQAQNQIVQLGNPLATKIFLQRMDEHCDALGIDVYWRDSQICPTEEELMEMIRKKSGSFVFPVEMLQVFSSNENDYSQLALNMGSYYYMLDDYYNLFQPKGLEKLAVLKQENHNSCNDVTESKMSLAVVHASQFPEVATELACDPVILKQRTSDPKLVDRAITLLKKIGSDEYMREKLRKLEIDIRKEIDQQGGNPYLSKLMDSLNF